MRFRGQTITWRPVATFPVAATVVGSTIAIAVGLALIPLREEVGSVNVALLMAAIVVVSAEFGGRVAGVIVGVVGSLVFNVFHTMPYYELVIDRTDEAVAAIVLIAFGLLIGSWHRRDQP